MKYFLILLTCLNMQDSTAQKATRIYLIRHAEKAGQSPDTELSDAGNKRALHWNDYFRDTHFDVVYSTDYKRTRETCAAIAAANHTEIINYEPGKMDLRQLAQENPGKTILIAGHSNTIPRYINAFLGKQKYPDMEESQFGNLYILEINGDSVTDTLLVP